MTIKTKILNNKLYHILGREVFLKDAQCVILVCNIFCYFTLFGDVILLYGRTALYIITNFYFR